MVGNERRRTNGSSHSTRNDSLSVPSSFPAMRPTFLSTFDRGSRFPVFSALCDYLSIAEIVSLTRTCKRLSDLYQYLVPIQWNIDKALQSYVDDPQGFRSQMAKSDALIFGDSALQYFERASWNLQPLNVLIEQDRDPELFSKYLLDIAGYSEINDFDYGMWFSMTEETRWTFKRHAGNETKIHVHVTRKLPVRCILEDVCTTADVSIISWNKAYSMFPLPTFVQHKGYLLQECDEVTAEVARMFSLRGWNIQGVMWPEEERSNHPIRERRRVGDRYTWTIPLGTENVKPSITPDYVLEHACFKVDMHKSLRDEESYFEAFEDVRQYTIDAWPLKSKVLKHTYLYGEPDMKDFFHRRLHSSTLLELRKLDHIERPTNYDQILRDPRDVDCAIGNFIRPTSWTYRDDEIPTWYKAFEKYKPK